MDLLSGVGGEVEDEHGEEGDAHAGDDQVHLGVVTVKIRILIIRFAMGPKIGILINCCYKYIISQLTV